MGQIPPEMILKLGWDDLQCKCRSRGVIREDKEGIRRSVQEGKTIQGVKTEGKATQRVKIRGKTTQPALLICQIKPY